MRRFDYDDNEENREDVDKFFGNGGEQDGHLTPDEYKALVEEEHQLQQIQLHLMNRELNDRLLFRVVRMLEKGFWWRFYSLSTRLKMIEKAFRHMRVIHERE